MMELSQLIECYNGGCNQETIVSDRQEDRIQVFPLAAGGGFQTISVPGQIFWLTYKDPFGTVRSRFFLIERENPRYLTGWIRMDRKFTVNKADLYTGDMKLFPVYAGKSTGMKKMVIPPELFREELKKNHIVS